MLKGIPSVLSPELLKVLCEMGHSDTIVIADGNFPAETIGKDAIVIRADGHGVTEILEAVLKVFPLDTYVEKPVSLMQVVPGDNVETPIWEVFRILVSEVVDRAGNAFVEVERFEFYEKAKNAYAVIATGETAIYANIMLQKGVVIN